MAKSCKGLAEELVKCLSESMCVKVICKTCNSFQCIPQLVVTVKLPFLFISEVLGMLGVGRETVNQGLRW